MIRQVTNLSLNISAKVSVKYTEIVSHMQIWFEMENEPKNKVVRVCCTVSHYSYNLFTYFFFKYFCWLFWYGRFFGPFSLV